MIGHFYFSGARYRDDGSFDPAVVHNPNLLPSFQRGQHVFHKVIFIERNDEILFQPLTKEYVRSVHGMLASETSVTKELLQERAKDREHEEAKLGKRRTR